LHLLSTGGGGDSAFIKPPELAVPDLWTLLNPGRETGKDEGEKEKVDKKEKSKKEKGKEKEDKLKAKWKLISVEQAVKLLNDAKQKVPGIGQRKALKEAVERGGVSLAGLKEICGALGLTKVGSKEELQQKVLACY